MGTETREEIMAATYRVLAEHGFAGLTTQRVADEADCSQSLVHYHYDTKADLVVAFIEWVGRGETDWLADLEGETAEERLLAFVDAQLGIPRDDEHGRFNVAFLELQAAAARNERYREALAGFGDLVHETLVDILTDGIAAGEFRDVDPDATAHFLRHALNGTVAAALTVEADAREPVRRATRAYVERVLLAEAA